MIKITSQNRTISSRFVEIKIKRSKKNCLHHLLYLALLLNFINLSLMMSDVEAKKEKKREASEIGIIVHGGAGTIPNGRVDAKYNGMKIAVRLALKILRESDDPVAAVEKAVNIMENLQAFNAGYGSVLTQNKEVEMDAIIINGTDLTAGAVGAIRNVANPISVAKLVKDKTDYVLLVGQQALDFALSKGVQFIPTKNLVAPNAKAAHGTTETDVGTVGAVAINSKGQIAVGTSTGGRSGKLGGRIGDSPLIGAGSFADDDICGLSATGDGESFMRTAFTSRVAHLIAQGKSVKKSCGEVLNFLTTKFPGSSGGCIGISKSGEIGFNFNSKNMAWAYVSGSDNVIHFGIKKKDNFTEDLGETEPQFPLPPQPDK